MPIVIVPSGTYSSVHTNTWPSSTYSGWCGWWWRGSKMRQWWTWRWGRQPDLRFSHCKCAGGNNNSQQYFNNFHDFEFISNKLVIQYNYKKDKQFYMGITIT
jgi:hypothetical protein